MDIYIYVIIKYYLLMFHIHFLKCCKIGESILATTQCLVAYCEGLWSPSSQPSSAVTIQKALSGDLSHEYYSNCRMMRAYLIFKYLQVDRFPDALSN